MVWNRIWRYDAALLIGTIHALNKRKLSILVSKVDQHPTPPPNVAKLKDSVSSMRMFDANKAAKNILSKPAEEYFVEVYVTETNEANGTGHVSASIIKKTDREMVLMKHISYMPCSGLSSFGAMAFGCVPVGATNAEHLRDEDIIKSNTIIRVPLTQDQGKKGLEAQESITQGAKDYTHLYAVTGEANIIALMLTKMVCATRGNEASIKSYTEDTGSSAPPEDLNGILVICHSYHPDYHVQSVVLNCTAAVQLTLEGSGLDIDDKYVLPKSLGNAVLNQCPGAERVFNSLVPPLLVEGMGLDKEKEINRGMNSYT